MLETALTKLLSLKVAAAAVVTVAATGGVAVAAATGTLPNPLGKDAAASTPEATGKPSAHPEKSAGKKADATPSPSLEGLCRAYKAGAGDNPGKALENPAFTALITAAGDKEKVAAYCDALLAQKADKNTPTARPTARPSHSAGKPESRPTAPESKPTDGIPGRMTPPPAN